MSQETNWCHRPGGLKEACILSMSLYVYAKNHVLRYLEALFTSKNKLVNGLKVQFVERERETFFAKSPHVCIFHTYIARVFALTQFFFGVYSFFFLSLSLSRLSFLV